MTVFWLTKLAIKSFERPTNITKNLTRINSVQEGFVACNSWVSVPIFFSFPFSKTMFKICSYLWHWSWCRLLYRGPNRLLCRRYQVWLHRWWTEWDQFINDSESRILNRCRISRRALLFITCSRRHRAEIWPQHIKHTLQYTLMLVHGQMLMACQN